ncbi:uncharacterized protein PHACADRAFT_214643 [Phanerochaete carnosa HHB-10118-sp]|uniref:Glucose-methanol-choline oxidoreductase C-terminal domain-containing protein n=1 Tax=Phanerochaete carnosa (strain HHB-10118-sp) TaxID=650164 RepID=K5VCN3_PHACS|nr:uncharacterized protein PHACADRAFT_214643 [Phanerochaete carnosa HHB-10118-sp]EKM48823.1 hypothetical protein PHACADRAFT_214643 [Phanerochaete carnosa HHB-10118-sp]
MSAAFHRALKSPQILELSGIGRNDVLSKIGVPVKLDLPGVGENMQEHMALAMSWELKNEFPKQAQELAVSTMPMAFFPLDQISDRAGEIYERAKEEIGKLDGDTVPAGYIDQTRLMLARLDPKTSSPTCEITTAPTFISGPNPPTPGKRYITFIVLVHTVFSRGTIHIKSSDPNEDPDLDPRYLERNVDADMLLEATKFARSLANTSPIKDMIVKEVNPGPSVQTDEQLLKWAKSILASGFHTASSLSMLPREKGGVVDPKLKVCGTDNLRVVDLSIVPLHICCHTQSTAYFIAEKAADIIRNS